MRSALFLVCFFFRVLPAFADFNATRDFIKSSTSGDKIEFYWSIPEGKGPFPALLMIHPEQESPKNGGESFVKYGQLDHWTKQGMVAIAISQPGYGSSEGSPDFCGPRTQNALLDLLYHMQAMPNVDKNHIFVYGGSRGAVVAARIASILDPKIAKLSGVILKSGVYDFVRWNQLRPWYDSIKLKMFWEIGWLNRNKLEDRSAYYFAENIKTPLLVIHGTQDNRAPISLAKKFAIKINETGGSAEFIEIDSEHVIPMPKINGVMKEFIRKLL